MIFKNYAGKILKFAFIFVSIYAYCGPAPNSKGVRI